jgi:rfaE bifunctional protein kinase chain/domain
MSSVEEIFERFKSINALIIGDVMVDSYIIGKVERVSPEAPVPVIDVEKREKRLGGAGNVARNVAALGATPILCSVLGDDEHSNDLVNLLKKNELTAEAIIKSPNRRTTIKTRVIGNNHQLLRIDQEDKMDLDESENDQLINMVSDVIDDIDVIILQDYDKGVLNKNNIAEIISIANANGVPTVVDPKKVNFLEYKNVSLFKPNLKELKEGLNLNKDLHSIASITKAERSLRDELNNELTMITLSEQGVFIADESESEHIPAHIRNISDVSGAGDTVVSVAALCVALGLDKVKIAALSNLAGGLVCEETGVVPVNIEKLKTEAKLVESIPLV